ncbi:MAG TPA: glutamate synthase subunit beta [Spirochaetota bacterium]|nr:glutamate synthase subunit beta [Spirochaetota bacterium]
MAKVFKPKNINNFKTIKRSPIKYRNVEKRIKDYKDVMEEWGLEEIRLQASRCQNCGVPFCHGYGCPISNYIPDWNELVYNGKWQEALELLHKTNNFPEITGRVCPALCEEACTLNMNFESVTIRNIELAIVEEGFKNGWIKPVIPKVRTGKKIAVIGSGPAGLAASMDLNRMGHSVTLFERDKKAGGFLRYGIPDFKLEKWIIDRRLQQMIMEGVEIKTDIIVGKDISLQYLQKEYDAILFTIGCREPRDLRIEGRELEGIYLATEYLKQSNEKVSGIKIDDDKLITAKGKNVLVIGGGDTGADCVGTAIREGALSVSQWEILPKPPEKRAFETPWPMFAKKLRTSTSHEEGCDRRWLISTKKFIGNKRVEKVVAEEVEWVVDETGKLVMKIKEGTEFEHKAELVLLAMGFVHTEHSNIITESNIELDKMGNIKTDNYGYGRTNVQKIYAAGDSVRGPSLVVWAIHYGKMVASLIDRDLKGI